MQTQQQYQIMHQHQQHQQQQQQQQRQKESSSSVAAFAARLLSLSAHELAWLHEDGELMQLFSSAQLHMESRLQTNQNKLLLQQQYDLYYRHSQHQAALNLLHQHQQQQQQAQLVLDLSGPNNRQQQQPAAAALAYNQPQQLKQKLHQQQHNQNNTTSSSSSSSSLSSRPFNPKKIKLGEYQLSCNTTTTTTNNTNNNNTTTTTAATITATERDHETAAELLALARGAPDTPETSPQQTLSSPAPPPHSVPIQVSSRPQQAQAAATSTSASTTSRKQAKKYKGEFDEPTPEEVERRQRALASPANYHRAIGAPHLGECACVLGSHFRDNRSVNEMLQIIERWRRLPAGERARTKWDVCDLPLDIPLADIKKYEDLRRQASRGRADFGGASKRKPLGIRGTRQFLLILYCLWGHPGRGDVMQREGYCPHCFAKIKKDNEQSTLVRVVNHFNMKHRRGANPRLSPNLQLADSNAANLATATSSGAATPVSLEARSPQTTTTVVKVEETQVVSSCADLENEQQLQQSQATSTTSNSSTATISA